MKINHPITLTLLAWAGMAIPIPSAHAAITSNLGELIIGFRASGGQGSNTNLEIDVGPASTYYNAAGGSTFAVPGLAVADLNSIYGNNWNTRTDLWWGVAGTTGNGPIGTRPKNTLWASKAEAVAGTASGAWALGSTFAQQNPAAAIGTMFVNGAPGTLSGASETGNSLSASAISSSLSGSWTSQDLKTAGTSFGYFNPTVDNSLDTIPTAGSRLDGTGYTVLDLYEMQPGSGAGTLLGAFGLNSAGNLMFSNDLTRFAPVPEPSGILMLGISLLAAPIGRRRRILES